MTLYKIKMIQNFKNLGKNKTLIIILLLLLKLTIINTTIKKLILHSVVLDPLENAKIKSVPKTSQYYAIYTKTFKKYVQILRI